MEKKIEDIKFPILVMSPREGEGIILTRPKAPHWLNWEPVEVTIGDIQALRKLGVRIFP